MGLRIDEEGGPGGESPNGQRNGNGPRHGNRRGSITRSVLNKLELEAQQQEKLDRRLARSKWLILPNSIFLKVWLAIIGPLIVYNVIWLPVEIFQMAKAQTLHAQIDSILDWLFWIDMVVNFRTAFIDKDNELCLDGKKIAWRYVGNPSAFPLDFVATVQWEIFLPAGSEGGALAIFRLPRILRLARLFKKLDMFPQLKVVKLLFALCIVAHIVGCMWFLVGWHAIWANNVNGAYGVSPKGVLSRNPNFGGYPTADPDSAFGDSWVMRHFGPKNLEGAFGSNLPVDESVAYKAGPVLSANGTYLAATESWGEGVVDVWQVYVTAIYWSFTMLMKSPHIGPDTWLEKLFACAMVLIGLFVTTQLVAVVTQIVMSFDKAHSAFRDRQQEYSRFSFSRSLPAQLRRKLLSYSLQDWSVNGGYDPNEVINSLGLPPALTHQMLATIYDDVVQESNMLKCIEAPVLHELLRYVKVVVSLQKETLIHQSDPCTRLYILRAGSLQASATDKLIAQTQAKDGGGNQPTKASKMSKMMGKSKMQVRMIEKPGDVICCASPFEPPQPLPFQVTSLKRTTLLSLHMQDLTEILDIVSEAQNEAVCKAMQTEHRNILLSVMPKTKGGAEASSRDSRMVSVADATDGADVDGPHAHFGEKDLSERRLQQIEMDVDRVIRLMTDLHRDARQIPRIVAQLSQMHGKPVPQFGPHATAALKEIGSPSESEVGALLGEVAG